MTGTKVKIVKGKLKVPNDPIIPFIEGDGTGAEIWAASVRVLDAAVEKAYKGKKKIVWKEVLAGEKAFNQTGNWLPTETLDIIREHLVTIKGPLTTPVGGGIRSLNVALRQELDLYACVRPVQYFKGVPSPVKEPHLVYMTIFRENAEDIYAGIEYQAGSANCEKLFNFLQNEKGVKKIRFPKSSSLGIKPVSKEGTEQLVCRALNYAVVEKKPSVSFAHMGNIEAYQSEYSFQSSNLVFPIPSKAVNKLTDFNSSSSITSAMKADFSIVQKEPTPKSMNMSFEGDFTGGGGVALKVDWSLNLEACDWENAKKDTLAWVEKEMLPKIKYFIDSQISSVETNNALKMGKWLIDKKQILGLMEEGEIELSLRILSNWDDDRLISFKDSIILKLGQLKRLKKNHGMMSLETHNTELNKIAASVLDLVVDVDKMMLESMQS